jgi:DNA (cytosine-5)-methyltransferase 1
LKFIDLFAGIGGFSFGLERQGHECVGWIEKDKFARKSYKAIHDTGGEYTARDIREVEPGDLPEHDMLTGGFPCQSFSTAGDRGGFKDTRGTLFFEILRLAKERKPEYLFLENVRGLLSHDGGNTFGTILNAMADVGYDAEWQVLNSKNFGVPQNRERVFIVGHLGGFSGRQVFPIREKTEKNNKEKQQGQIIRELGYTNGDQGFMQSENVLAEESVCTTLQGAHIERVLVNNDGTERNYFSTVSSGGNSAMDDSEADFVLEGGKIRKLTPKECFRLQGFPDSAFDKSQEVNSDTQLYKQAGNAVTVNVIEAISERF